MGVFLEAFVVIAFGALLVLLVGLIVFAFKIGIDLWRDW